MQSLQPVILNLSMIKTFEHVYDSCLDNVIESNNPMSKFQHACCRKRGTNTAPTSFVDQIVRDVEQDFYILILESSYTA